MNMSDRPRDVKSKIWKLSLRKYFRVDDEEHKILIEHGYKIGAHYDRTEKSWYVYQEWAEARLRQLILEKGYEPSFVTETRKIVDAANMRKIQRARNRIVKKR